MKFLARVNVMLKPSLLDPQGEAISSTLKKRGYLFVEEVRVGKHIVIVIEARDMEDAKIKTKEICEKILHNRVIEFFEFSIVPINNISSQHVGKEGI